MSSLAPDGFDRGEARRDIRVRLGLLKLLESATIKLASVASDVFGISGMAMVRAIAQHAGSFITVERSLHSQLPEVVERKTVVKLARTRSPLNN